MKEFERWQTLRLLSDKGGQGDVYLVRDPRADDDRRKRLEELALAVRDAANSDYPQRISAAEEMVRRLDRFREVDTRGLGALKEFRIPESGSEAEKARGRLRREIEVLKEVQHPAILKLLDASGERGWVVTEYHPCGILSGHRDRFKAKPQAALEAFRPLAAALVELHNRGIVHRDIKPDNIFLAMDGRLILGDFGIVFFRDENGERLTDTFERVGTRDWMAPWAHTGRRLDQVGATFDVFSLGKVVWAMVSGQQTLPYWYHRRDEFNLEKLFPDDGRMVVVNQILDSCVVEEEKRCVSSTELLAQLDAALQRLRGSAQVLLRDSPHPCRMCGQGKCTPEEGAAVLSFSGRPLKLQGWVCDMCGYVELFYLIEAHRQRAWIEAAPRK